MGITFTSRVNLCRPDFPAHHSSKSTRTRRLSRAIDELSPGDTALGSANAHPTAIAHPRLVAESQLFSEILRKETVGGVLLLAAAGAALVRANSPWSPPTRGVGVRGRTRIAASAPELSTWAADGLLAIFFFVVGLELKREFVAGDLRDPARPHCRSPPRSAG